MEYTDDRDWKYTDGRDWTYTDRTDWTHSADQVPFTLWASATSEHYAGTTSFSPRRNVKVDQWDRASEFGYRSAPHAIKLLTAS